MRLSSAEGAMIDEAVSEDAFSQERDAMTSVYLVSSNHTSEDREEAVDTGECLAVLAVLQLLVLPGMLFSSCLGWIVAAPAAARGVILGRQLILGESSYRLAIAA